LTAKFGISANQAGRPLVKHKIKEFPFVHYRDIVAMVSAADLADAYQRGWIAMSEDFSLKTILVPLDGSDFSIRVAKYAIKIAELSTANLVCVHSVVSLPYTGYATAGVIIKQYIDDSREEVEKWYDEVRAMASSKEGVKVMGETILDVISIADSIINYAEKKKC
jgi:hypothetical protein